MDMTDLQTFRAVVAHGGVSAAARQLHRVQSSISARLAGLERSLGCRLFERQGKRLVLTPEGRHLHERSAGLVDEIERLRHELAFSSAGAVLRIGAMESTAAVRLVPPLAALRREHPQCRLTLRTGTTGALLDLLERCEVDAVFVAGPADRPGLDWQAAFVEELVMIAPRQGGAADTLVTFSSGCAYREVALAWSQAQAAPLAQTVEIGSYHALVASVAAGMGCGVVPRSVLQRCDASGVRVRRLGRPHDRQTTWLVTRPRSASQALQALRRAVLG
ncbi:MAG: LysR family transcriptional regulator [Ramlibacter sp.]|nr:LysR family transcriptional regulator [Ramlibacter sp.]